MRIPVLALALLVTGCATTPPVGPPAASAPDLRGTWTGTWGGAPATLMVTEQALGPGDSGLVLGPWQVLGEPYPRVSGVLTASAGGELVSTRMDGLLSQSGNAVVLNVRARSRAGEQYLTLRLDGDRLLGTGDSQYPWGPRGPARLLRQ
jgi:hypothetical protein